MSLPDLPQEFPDESTKLFKLNKKCIMPERRRYFPIASTRKQRCKFFLLVYGIEYVGVNSNTQDWNIYRG